MGTRGFYSIALSILFSACAHAQTALPSNEWSQILHPSAGATKSIGFYSHGCITGAQTLPLDGTGYQVMKVVRNRYYGHPSMLEFLKDYGQKLDAVGSAILIGDIGQPRGGPMPYGHASHQVGLDVDLWYWTHPEQRVRSLTVDERNNLNMKTVLNANGVVDPTLFTAETITKLKLAASDPKVERIFVNPAIKTYLCSTLPASEHYWLHALRPWPGHDDHFHVRISCTADSPDCTHQDPQPAGDGCNELISAPVAINLDVNTVNFEHAPEMPPAVERIITEAASNGLPAACSAVLRQ